MISGLQVLDAKISIGVDVMNLSPQHLILLIFAVAWSSAWVPSISIWYLKQMTLDIRISEHHRLTTPPSTSNV